MPAKSQNRYLARGIYSVIEEMNSMYGANLKDEELMERHLSDIALRAKLEELTKNIVRIVKLAERRRDEELTDVGYTIMVSLNSEGIDSEIKIRTQ